MKTSEPPEKLVLSHLMKNDRLRMLILVHFLKKKPTGTAAEHPHMQILFQSYERNPSNSCQTR